jgi:hypothetical protein
MLRVSFGSNNRNQNNRTINRNSTLTAPTLLVAGLLPGWYTVTMTRTDVPYLHWIKVNMPSTIKAGKEIVPYEPAVTDPALPTPALSPMHFEIVLWRQTRGRLTPPPTAPTSRSRFNLDSFARKQGLEVVDAVRFFVS